MDVPPSMLSGPRLKIERANRHIETISSMTNILDCRIAEIILSADRSRESDGGPIIYKLYYRPINMIPESFALVIGDAIHNLRGALDHLAYEIVARVEPESADKIYFPFGSEWDYFADSKHINLIERALPGSKELLITQVRPKNGENERLWSFSHLHNVDKHRLLIPTVTFQRTQLWATIGSMQIGGSRFGNDASKVYKICRSEGYPINISQKPEITVDVCFGSETPFEGESVIGILTKIMNIASETISNFEKLLSLSLCNT